MSGVTRAEFEAVVSRVAALEQAAPPVAGELLELEAAPEVDPVQKGFEEYRARARAVEERREREGR